MIDTATDNLADDTGTTEAAKRLAHRRDRHRTMLGVSLAIVACAFLMQIDSSGHVEAKGLPNLPLPELCGSRVWFGVDCPGCGLTRSFIALARGQWAESLHFNRVGWILALAVLAQIPYRIHALSKFDADVAEPAWPKYFGWALIAMLIGSWLGKMTGLF